MLPLSKALDTVLILWDLSATINEVLVAKQTEHHTQVSLNNITYSMESTQYTNPYDTAQNSSHGGNLESC
jgi:hypothetical protein